MDIGSFQRRFVLMNCVKCAFVLVILQPLVAVSLPGVMVNNRPPSPKTAIIRPMQPVAAVPKNTKIHLDGNSMFLYQDKRNPGKQLKLTADISISVYALYQGEVVESKYFLQDDLEYTAGTYSKGSAVVLFKLPPANAYFEITFDPFKPSLAYSNQQHIIPEFMFQADTMFPDLEEANGFVCFKGPKGTVADSLDIVTYKQTPCEDNKLPVSEYEYHVNVEMNTLRLGKNPTRSLRASDDKQVAGGSVGIAIGVVLAAVAVVAVAAAIGLVVRRRVNADMATSEKSSLVTLTLS